MSSVQNFSVPFNMPITGGMFAGKMIIVQGTIPSMSKRFAVNLITHSGDIAFHICPRFKENRVVRNNVLNMNWGPEESQGSLPVHPGQNFDMMILCETYNFKVAFNKRHFCEFSHRLPFNTISNLAVDGEVIIHSVNIKEQNSFGNNNNNSNSVPYGFQPTPNYGSAGLYPSIDSYPYPPASNRSPSPSVPHYPSSGPAYPSPGHSPYPTQPGYPNIPQQNPYPTSPNHNSGGFTPSPHNKPGILDQAGAALAGVLGPGLLAGGMNKKYDGYGRPNLMDQAGSALAGILGGGGLARGGTSPNQKGPQPHGPAPQTDILGQAGTALAGLLGGAGLARAATQGKNNTHDRTPQNDILGTAGSALAGLLGGGGSTRAVTQGKGTHNPTPQNDILGTAGSALAGLLGGGGLGGRQQPLPTRRPAGSIFDEAGSALSGLLGGGRPRAVGSSPTRHPQSAILDQALDLLGGDDGSSGVLGGTLGTVAAGAALTGHLNPIKATKKQLKAHKKALKYGLPIAGVGLGAYALHKGLKKGFRRSSSSSSCSSSD